MEMGSFFVQGDRCHILGLVVSELAWSNIDPKLPFVTVVPELLLGDQDYLQHLITENALQSSGIRKQIRDYAESWSWSSIVKNVYVPNIKLATGK